MFAVPEVDDDIDPSSSSNNDPKPPPNQSEIITTESLLTTSTPVSLSEKEEKSSIITSIPPPPATSKQHLSRLSLFQRNTIHVCEQISDHPTAHQQHHSAPPSHNQQSKTGLDAIHENGEYPSTTVEQQQQQQQQQLNTLNNRFPRSSTVPYSSYATVRKSAGNPDNPTIVHRTISPAQLNSYYNTRQPFALINTNFQPISPHHHHHPYPYNTRPVDILKPTFLIVPKVAEQQLTAQLSASNSPVQTIKTKKIDPKSPQKTVSLNEQSSPINRTNENLSPTITTMASGYKHIGLLGTPNPSPYVHFVNVTYPTQSSQEGLPESSILQEQFNNYQPSTSIRSMPNISLTQVSPQHVYGSSHLRYYPQPTTDDQQQQQQQQQVENNNNSESKTVRSATAPVPPSRIEIGETDESSVASFDFAQTDFVDMPGSWRYQSIPIRAIPRRYRAPIPQAFIDQQHYLSDSEQVVHSASYRQQQLFGSIPTINRPFDSIRSQQATQFGPSLRLSDKDILKIASFYKSMGTLVHVAHSLATLYASDFDAMANLKDWKRLYTGVPIWLFNTGMNPKRTRSIRLLISELGSSFTLWDTIVNGASDVRLPKPRHITLKSLETGTIFALKFDDTNATDEFHQYFVKLSCDPRNSDLFDVFNAKRRRPVFLLRKKKIRKSAISKPSQFNHINKVDEHDKDSLYTFSVLVDDGTNLS